MNRDVTESKCAQRGRKRFALRLSRSLCGLLSALAMVLGMAGAHVAMAQTAYTDSGAWGAWSDPSIWSPSGIPGPNDTAYIGGTSSIANVWLSGDQSVGNLYVGSATDGELELQTYQLTVNGSLVIGTAGGGWGNGSIQQGNGSSFSALSLALYGNSLTLSAADVVRGPATVSGAQLTLSGGAVEGAVTMSGAQLTVSAGAVDGAVTLSNASQLTISGGNILGNVTVSDASSGTISISGGNILGNVAVSDNSQLTMPAYGGIDAYISSGSTLTLATSLPGGQFGSLTVDQSSMLNMAGHPLTTGVLCLAGSVANRGAITAGNLSVSNQAFDLSTFDAVTNFSLSGGTCTLFSPVSSLNLTNGAQAWTNLTGSVSGSVSLGSGSTLTLAAPLTLSGGLNVDATSTLIMAANPLTAPSASIFGAVQNRGPITVGILSVGNQTFDLNASDTVTTFLLSGATSTLNTPVSSLTVDNRSLATVCSAVGAMSVSDFSQATAEDGAAPMSSLTVNNASSATACGGVSSVSVAGDSQATIGGFVFSLSVSNNSQATACGGVSSLTVSNTSQATVATPAGSPGESAYAETGSTLTLGGPLALSGELYIDPTSTLDMAGQPLTASYVTLASAFGQSATLRRRGAITAYSLAVTNQAFNLIASDAVANFLLSNGTSTLASSVSSLNLSNSAEATTTSTGSVNGSVTLTASSTLTLGSAMTLSGELYVDPTSTLNMAGHPLTASSLYLGANNGTTAIVLGRSGGITTNSLTLTSQAFNLLPADTVTNFNLGGSTSTIAGCVSFLTLYNASQAATVSATSLSGNAYVESGSTLALGAPLALSGPLDVEGYSTLDMGGQPLSAPYVYLGWNYGQPVNVLHRGPITTGNLFVAAGTFDLSASDAVTNFSLSNGTSTLSSSVSSLGLSNSALVITTVAGSVSGSVGLLTRSTLTLQAPLTLSGQFDMEQYSTLNMQGHSLSAASVYLGWEGYGQPVNLWAGGAVTANNLGIGSGSALTLTSGSDVVDSQITLSQNSTLAVQPASVTGLTFKGRYASTLSVNDTSTLQLTAGANGGPSWLFRWQDPAGATWTSALSGLIAARNITITSPAGYSLFDEEGYTYIAAGSTLVWSGTGGDNSWSNTANWGGATPSAGQWLRFAALTSGASAVACDNLPGNPLFYGIFFDSQAPSYNLQGNAIQLSGDVLNQSDNDQTISLDVQLVPGNGAFNMKAVTFDTGGKNITVGGSISGAGMALVKTGSGTLTLSGTNTYQGGTVVGDGTLILTNNEAIADGTSLIVGDPSAFAAPIVPNVVTGLQTEPTAAAIAPVPEPGALALLAAGAIGLVGYRLRRRRSPRKASPS
jgi:autotransporter-associated beta strand protein